MCRRRKKEQQKRSRNFTTIDFSRIIAGGFCVPRWVWSAEKIEKGPISDHHTSALCSRLGDCLFSLSPLPPAFRAHQRPPVLPLRSGTCANPLSPTARSHTCCSIFLFWTHIVLEFREDCEAARPSFAGLLHTMGEWEDPYNVLGFVGGVVLAAALLPQIYLAHKRESTADISYMWQASAQRERCFFCLNAQTMNRR